MTIDGSEIVASDLTDRVWTALTAKLGVDRVSLWLDGPQDLEFREGQCEIHARDRFTAERIRRGIVGEVKLVLAEVSGSRWSVSVVERKKPYQGKTLFDSQVVPTSPPVLPIPKAAPVSQSHTNTPSMPIASLSPSTVPAKSPSKAATTLESFVEGDSNRLAFRAARSVVERVGVASPMLFCGPTGTGKTHLLDGIVDACRRGSRRLRALSLTADQFTSLFIEALQGQGLPSFRRKYRDVDVFVLDDIQFLPGKRATLVELHHTISEIERAGGQVVLGSDRPLAELTGIGPELLSRIQAGMVCSLAPLDLATRKTILAAQLAQRGIALDEEVIDALAAALPGDGRLLRGSINRIELLAAHYGERISWQIIRETLGDLLSFERSPVHLEDISRIVADFFGVPLDSLRSGSKLRSVSGARMLAMWLARQHTRSGLTEIGRHFGSRSHSTVISAKQRVDELRETNEFVPGSRTKVTIADAIVRLESRLKVS